MRVVFGVLVLLAMTGAVRAQDNPACAKYQDPLAYNACLAKLGPPAGVSHTTSAPPVYGSRPTRSRFSLARARRGRVEAVFRVSGK